MKKCRTQRLWRDWDRLLAGSDWKIVWTANGVGARARRGARAKDEGGHHDGGDDIHYPTDSSLLGDGARVLTRTMKKVEKSTGGLKKRIRDRMRSVNKKVMAIALARRLKGPDDEERRIHRYRELVSLTRKILYQAEGVLGEIQNLVESRCGAVV